jgi:hypothetical protein
MYVHVCFSHSCTCACVHICTQLATSSGEEDLCYYNFKCSHPVGVLSSFNNVWSNVGYILLGVLFIIVTFIRETRYTRLRKQKRPCFEKRGIPQFFGIYYAMGLALILEGLMSSLYHICPTNANFQFDTAFMFIIAGLMLTKVFQNRHPDIHANAFIAFFSFAVVIFFTLLGIVCDGHVVQSLKHTVGLYICWYLYPAQHYDQRNPVAVRCSLLAMTVLMVAGFFTSFYYFHRWKLCEFYIHCTSKPVRIALFTLLSVISTRCFCCFYFKRRMRW